MSGPVRPHGVGAVVAVRIVPGSGRAGVVGRHGEELKVRVCSPPVDGRANEELCAVLADALGVKPRDVTVVGGQTSRSKQVSVALDAEVVGRRLAPWIGPSAGPGR